MIYRHWHFLPALSIDIHKSMMLALFEEEPKKRKMRFGHSLKVPSVSFECLNIRVQINAA